MEGNENKSSDVQRDHDQIRYTLRGEPSDKVEMHPEVLHVIFDSGPSRPPESHMQKSSPSTGEPKLKEEERSNSSVSRTAEAANQHPWPQIKNILENSTLLNMLQTNAMATVAEKLDGSNLSINSNGDVSSRRCLLLQSATEPQLCSFRFAGNTLENLVRPIRCCKKMKEHFSSYFPFLNPLVIVYGEFLQEGTATCKADKFRYRDRGFQKGHLYAFGVGITFAEKLTKEDIDKVNVCLREKGFSSKVHSGGNGGEENYYCILILNRRLVELLHEFEFLTLQVEEMPLVDVFRTFETSLLKKDTVEGVVITVPSEGKKYKWKGIEDSFSPQKLAALESVKETLRDWPAVVGPLVRVVENALKVQMEVKKEQLHVKNLKKALKSAQSKYPTLQEYYAAAVAAKSNESKESILKRYGDKIKTEMKSDTEGDKEFIDNVDEFVDTNFLFQAGHKLLL